MKKAMLLWVVGMVNVAIADGGVSNSATGIYAGVDGGVAIVSGNIGGDVNAGPDLGGRVGYRMGKVRFEGAFNYYSNSISFATDYQLKMTTLMANVYYDFGNATVYPFVGVGIGWLHAWLTGPIFLLSPEDNEFAYQAIAGLGAHLSPHWTLDVSYHRLGWSDANGFQNLVEAGVNYQF